jgi:hypothetical protein
VIVATSTVLMLALMEVGTAEDEFAGACANISDLYASANWLQSAVRPLAAFARFCDS